MAASLLGANSRFVGKIGDDKYGHDALDMYKRYGISTEMVKIDPGIHSGIMVYLLSFCILKVFGSKEALV